MVQAPGRAPLAYGDHIELVLHTDSGGNPGTLLAGLAATTESKSGWKTVLITPTTLAGADCAHPNHPDH